MIPVEHEQLFRRLAAAEMHERRVQLPQSFAQAIGGLPAGMHRSGRVGVVLMEVARRELRGRTDLVWQVLQTVLSAVGITLEASTAPSLKTLMLQAIERERSDIATAVAATWTTGLPTRSTAPLDDEAREQGERMAVNIDLLLESLRRRSTPPTTAAPIMYNFHGPIGAVMTAPGAAAYVTQTFGEPEVQLLQQALGAIAGAIPDAVDVPAQQRAELSDAVHTLTAELQRERPNAFTVRNMATGLATAIQTMGSLAPAYALLRSALLAIGITIP